jgi:hypothetical protein
VRGSMTQSPPPHLFIFFMASFLSYFSRFWYSIFICLFFAIFFVIGSSYYLDTHSQWMFCSEEIKEI